MIIMHFTSVSMKYSNFRINCIHIAETVLKMEFGFCQTCNQIWNLYSTVQCSTKQKL